MSLSKKMDKLKIIGIDGHALVASLQNCSHAITSLASMITENTDPLVVDQHIIQRLSEVRALMDEIDKAVQKAMIAQIDLGNVTTSSKSLREANDAIQNFFIKFSNDNKEIIGAHNITLEINQNAISAANMSDLFALSAGLISLDRWAPLPATSRTSSRRSTTSISTFQCALRRASSRPRTSERSSSPSTVSRNIATRLLRLNRRIFQKGSRSWTARSTPSSRL